MSRSWGRILAGLGVIVVVAAPTSSLAKVQRFTVDWSPQEPVIGEPVVVTVRFWNDAAHSDRARWPSRGTFEGFLWAFPEGSSPATLRDAVRIDVTAVRPGEMRGEVVFRTVGVWTICQWSAGCTEPDVPGNPGRMQLTVSLGTPLGTTAAVREAPEAPRGEGLAAPIAMATVAVGAAIGAVGLRGIRRRRRR